MPIINTSIQNQIFEIIKKEIFEKKYKFGEQINPKVIAEENGISVMPVRDALLQLVNQGLVINKARVGFFVANFSKSDIKDIMEVRKMFELYCLGEGFERIDRREIEDFYNKMKNKKLSKQEFYELDYKMHNSIILAADNKFLMTQYERIKDLFMLFVYYDTTHDKEAYKEHEQVIQAIMNNNKKRAVNELEKHLDRVEKEILAHL